MKLLDVATDKTFCYQSGFLSKKNTFQKGLFEQWVLSRLDWAPHGEWLCSRRGRKLTHWPIVSASHHHKLLAHPDLDHQSERLVCITDLLEGITAQLGDTSTNTTPRKPVRTSVDDGTADEANITAQSKKDLRKNIFEENLKKRENDDSMKPEQSKILNNVESVVDACGVSNACSSSDISGSFVCVKSENGHKVSLENRVQNGNDQEIREQLNNDTSDCGEKYLNCHSTDVSKDESNHSNNSVKNETESSGKHDLKSSAESTIVREITRRKSTDTTTINASCGSSSASEKTQGSKGGTTGVSNLSMGSENSSSGGAISVCDLPPLAITVNMYGSPVRRAASLLRSDSVGAVPVLLDIKIRRCSKSQVYILQPLRHVLLHKLHDCKVVLGPVRGRLRMMECRNLTVIAPARSVVISDCRNLTLYTMTPNNPLLVGGASSGGLSSVTAHQGVTLAPLNMHYPKLLQHLSMTGLKTNLNKWNQPLRLGVDGRIELSECGIQCPDEFQLLSLPFFQATVDGRPPLLPPGLPCAYSQSVEQSQQVVCSLRAEVREAALTADQRLMLQKAIDHRFKAWLRETNKQRELDLLHKFSTKLKTENAAIKHTATAV
uniref:TBCC domain-containing protein 1 n=1 Tax=Hirondellea gigas TaxID=1518452 RepID=A0A6A7FQI9_9CRUS